jgi:hypothetical protein
LTNGKSATEFGSRDSVTASQYLTFVLRALGYESGRDFEWDSAWTLTNQLGITNGEYNSGNNKSFKRGDAASVSFDALKAINKATDEPLFESLLESGAIKREAAESVGLISSKPIIPTPEPTPAPAPTSETDIERVVRVLKSFKSISDISISGDTVSYTVEGFSGDYIVIYETPEEAYRAAHNSMISSSRFENIVMYMNVQINAETYEYLRTLEELSRELYFEFCLTDPAANS